MEADDPVTVDQNGKHLQGKRSASQHLPMHLHIYRTRPDVRSIVHILPPYATAFSVAGVGLEEEILPSIMISVGKIGITDHVVATPEASIPALDPLLENHSAIVMRNYGLVTFGKSITEAFDRAEMVEQYAQILHLARQLGNVHGLPSDEFKRLELMRSRMESAWDTKGRR
jgi:L-fuculose-phosphate aldolase